jgi:tetratricopeptide (TPR) repeat protein
MIGPMAKETPINDVARERTAVSAPTLNGCLGHKPWLLAVVLGVATFGAYWPALSGKFVWDDDSWTTRPAQQLRDLSGLRSIWCQPTTLQQYYPVTGTTFWLDYHLWGFWTLPYHVENILLHVLAALLFWRLLCRLEVPGAWLAGAIFAVHPVMVESAAWITERKNVLSLVLYLGALSVYGRWASFWKAEDDSSRCARYFPTHWGGYLLAWLLALGALLAKTTAFSLPAVILLICWWKRGRIRWRADVLPTVPFFALAIGVGLITARLERTHVGANGPEWAIPFSERCLVAGRALVFYISKLVWPANLCFVYPRWQLDAHALRQWLYPCIAGGTVLALWSARNRFGRGPAAAALFFVGALFPVLGFMNAYFMRYSFVCDHWVYLPSLGPIALAAAGIATAFKWFWRRPVFLESTVYGTLLLVLAALTWRQAHIYHDPETLWQSIITKNSQSWLAHNNLGNILLKHGRLQEAMGHYQQALLVKPDCAEAHGDLGNAFILTGKLEEAIEQYKQAVQMQPQNPGAHYDLGNALLRADRAEEAIKHYEQALRLKPDDAEALLNLATALLRLGKTEEAVRRLDQWLQVNPGDGKAHSQLGTVLIAAGKPGEAIRHLEQALRIRADDAEAHNSLGLASVRQGRLPQAIGHYEQAIRFQPDFADPYNNLAWLLATHALTQGGNGVRAVALAQRACELAGNSRAGYLDTLAAAYAAAGRFREAIATAEKAIELARATSSPKAVGEYEARLELYRSGRAYFQPVGEADK